MAAHFPVLRRQLSFLLRDLLVDQLERYHALGFVFLDSKARLLEHLLLQVELLLQL